MPFFIYSTTQNGGGSESYEFQNTFELAGNTNGLIYKALSARGIKEEKWVLENTDLLKAADIDPASHALVIDPTPDRKAEVTLLKIVRIAGHSGCGWTPLMLVLDVLKDESVKPEKRDEIKKKFLDNESEHNRVYTFLYLLGDHKGGTWRWGKVGKTNGALLWQDTFDYFMEISRRR